MWRCPYCETDNNDEELLCLSCDHPSPETIERHLKLNSEGTSDKVYNCSVCDLSDSFENLSDLQACDKGEHCGMLKFRKSLVGRNEHKKKPNLIWIMLTMVGFLSTIIVWKSQADKTESIEHDRDARIHTIQRQLDSKSNELSAVIETNRRLEQSIETLESDLTRLRKIANSYPELMITDLSLQPDSRPFNTTIRSTTNYVYSKIKINSLITYSKSVEVQIKIFQPNGELEKGNVSTDQYTFKQSIRIPGDYLTDHTIYLDGWGSVRGDTYHSGKYRYEIWYSGRMLYQTYFNVY